jgi:MerR family transcriptional regulator, light-induced transcriptional regulator
VQEAGMGDFRRRTDGNEWATPLSNSDNTQKTNKKSRKAGSPDAVGGARTKSKHVDVTRLGQLGAQFGIRSSMQTGTDSERERLARTIESEIVPRLLLSSGFSMAQGLDDGIRSRLRPGPGDIAELTRCVMQPEAQDSTDFVAALRRKGVSAEAMYLELFAPVARRLGEYWEADVCSFVDVTIGLSRLQRLIDKQRSSHEFDGAPDLQARRILLVPARGEQHTFALSILCHFFRRATWDVLASPDDSFDGLIEFVRKEHVDVIGLSLSQDDLIAHLKRDITALRDASRYAGVTVLIGGPAVVRNPGCVSEVGADAMAADALEAVQVAGTYVPLPARNWM